MLAADSYGHGRSPALPSDRKLALRDEVALLEPVFDRAGETFTLIGHSYGAAVALVAATLMPERVRALALYEPTLFSLIDAEKAPPNDANGIRATVAGAVALLIADGPAAAAERFIDYWSGIGAWASMPQERRAPIEAAIVNIAAWAHALLKEPTPLAAFAALDIPVLLMVGGKSPPSSRGVARVLTGAMRQLERVDLPDLGHMGPVTHPQVVNEVIASFLARA
jgi:pimeloyl-ACP methyl ester carboxylesterase